MENVETRLESSSLRWDNFDYAAIKLNANEANAVIEPGVPGFPGAPRLRSPLSLREDDALQTRRARGIDTSAFAFAREKEKEQKRVEAPFFRTLSQTCKHPPHRHRPLTTS